MSELICICDTWKYYCKNYDEVFTWYSDVEKWYIIWTRLSESDGLTSVDKFAIPIRHCPSCGGILNSPKDE